MANNFSDKTGSDKNGTCDTCAYNEYDEEFDEYFCSIDMDEDDVARMMQNPRQFCPFYRDGDEYSIVRHQM